MPDPLPTLSPLEAALAAAPRTPAGFEAALERFGHDRPLETGRDVLAVGAALAELIGPQAPTRQAETRPRGPAATLAGLLQDVATPEALEAVRVEVMPALLAWYDFAATLPGTPAEDVRLLLLKVFAMFDAPGGTDRLLAAIKEPLRADDPMWAVIFREFDGPHPARHKLVGLLREPLPPGLIGLAYLNLCNATALAGEMLEHPFANPVGAARLKGWVTSREADELPAGKVVATAVPFLPAALQAELLPQIMKHPDPHARLEGAWAAARLGDERGKKLLAEACLDPYFSPSAAEYLKELGLAGLIPPVCHDPGFQAASEMCRWLAHPMEYGRPPDQLELVDAREMWWPPTNDRRPMRLFRFGYHVHEDDDLSPIEWKLGLVGSIAFSLWLPDAVPAEDAYALHCCWELQSMRDPRAPAERTVEAGKALLAAAPPAPKPGLPILG